MRRIGVLGVGFCAVGAVCGALACGGGDKAGVGSGPGGAAGANDSGAAASASANGGTKNTGGSGGTPGQRDGGSTGGTAGSGAASNSGGGGSTGTSSGDQDAASSGGAKGRDAGVAVRPTSWQKLDVLLLIDNSISMADKQAVLRRTVPDLVQQLTDPTLGITDLHVGVVTSSLGGHGTTLCGSSGGAGLTNEESNDGAHLVGTRPRAVGLGLSNGFASWTKALPPSGLIADVQGLVGAAGEFGCGLEATLEAAYRFLADPKPYQSITTGPCTSGSPAQCAFPTGVDSELLAERTAFLRPDSALAVVVLSDENDCSIRDGGQYYYAANSAITLPKGSSACQANPNDPCCYPCGSAVPPSCTADPACQTAADPKTDQINLRCFEQKRRFGYDFLYPVARYVNALSRPRLCTSRADLDATGLCPDTDANGSPDLFDNPLFSGLVGPGNYARDPSMVYVLGIVGVPWQTIRAKTDANGNPLPIAQLVYPDSNALVKEGLWPVILGDASQSPPLLASDPLMHESIAARTGTTPGTGEALAPVTAGYLANSVNGHEWANTALDDLQYSCIFSLDQPRDCSAIAQLNPRPGCDCDGSTPSNGNPLCQTEAGTYGAIQYFAKAYPGLRELAMLRGLGANAGVASICARNLTDDTRRDFGYRPALDALVDRIRISAVH